MRSKKKVKLLSIKDGMEISFGSTIIGHWGMPPYAYKKELDKIKQRKNDKKEKIKAC